MFGRRIHASQSGGFADAPANGRYMSWAIVGHAN